MKTKIVSAFMIAAAALTGGALAQTANVSTSMPAPSTPAPAVMPSATPAPNQVVYSPRLPSPTELSNAAAAQGLTVLRIEQSGSQIIAIYQYSNGQTNTVSYQLLPASGAYAPVTADVGPPPTVIYTDSPRVVYYDGPGYGYYPGYWYPPVSLGIGLGFRGGYGFHGGFRGGYGFRGHWR